MVAILRLLVGLPAGWLASKLLAVRSEPHGATGPSVRGLVGRRAFVRNATLGAVGVVTAEIGIGFYLLFKPNKTGAFGGPVNVAAGQVPGVVNAPLKVPAGKFWLARNDDGLLALYWKCPHLGCTVPWAATEDRFHCPCHGSVYEKNGAYVAGPAPRGLDLMAIEVNPETGNIVVDTGQIATRGRGYDPSLATPYQF